MMKGQFFSLKSAWEHYSNLLSRHFCVEPGAYRSNRFKDKVLEFLGEKVTFVQPLDTTNALLIVPSDFSEVAMKTMLQHTLEEESCSEDDNVLQPEGREHTRRNSELVVQSGCQGSQ